MLKRDFFAWRHVPWGGASGAQDLVLMGLDWSAAAFAMQVRAAAGETGTALVSLVNAAPGAEGISASYDPTYIYPLNGANTALRGTVVGATTIRPQIAQTTLEAIPGYADPSQPVGLWYDLHVTPAGMPRQQFAYGQFTLYPGVTL